MPELAQPVPIRRERQNSAGCDLARGRFRGNIAPMNSDLLNPGEKIHVVHRRQLDTEPHRHFVGVVDQYAGGVIRMTGHLYVVDKSTFQFVKRPEVRTRVVSVVSGEIIVNILPAGTDLEKIVYKLEGAAVRVTDGTDWHLDLSEVGWK
jgi:hypothetical protein